MWGKIIGGLAGLAVGGPWGAVAGVALGHAAETSGLARLGGQLGTAARGMLGGGNAGFLASPQALPREQVFAISVVVLAAKLAKCDGAVSRAEIDAFKRHFQVPAAAAREVARLFDQARDSPEGFEGYALHMGEAFADNHGLLEDVLAALFAIARADKPVTVAEQAFLEGVWRGFGLDHAAFQRASGRASVAAASPTEDPYAVLGVSAEIGDDELRAAWRQLMRENHPDSLAGRGVPAEFIARAGEKVAKINAAWDVIKKQRGM